MLDFLPAAAAIISVLVAVINGLIVVKVLLRRRMVREKNRSDGHEWSESYELAISRVQRYIKRSRDGTLFLDLRSGDRTDIDPVLFADLERSLDETNKKILTGEISREEAAEIAL